uniref:Uncharacterized protein n=1 Tax=Globodera pallida TaxID=36090 RepID=A0A183CN50_GLOPA
MKAQRQLKCRNRRHPAECRDGANLKKLFLCLVNNNNNNLCHLVAFFRPDMAKRQPPLPPPPGPLTVGCPMRRPIHRHLTLKGHNFWSTHGTQNKKLPQVESEFLWKLKSNKQRAQMMKPKTLNKQLQQLQY